MLMKYNYLLATLFIYLNLISNVFCCSPTTLTVWKYISQTTTAEGVNAYIEAKISVKGEGSREFTGSNKVTIKPNERYEYKQMFSSDKRFYLFAGYYSNDLTYVWKNPRYQYLERPSKVETDVWKYQGLDTENKRLGGFLEARLHVKGEGKREFTGKDVMFFHPYDVDGYNNKASKDKKFTLFASWVKKDLTYVWKDSKYQYLETPAREEKKSNGKLKLTYYGCV
ncbi:unnamed protein product [Cunninghamella blakesleeana]